MVKFWNFMERVNNKQDIFGEQSWENLMLPDIKKKKNLL